MELLPILLLLSIFAITTCDEEVNKSFCGLCGYFRLFQKVDFKEVEENCKKHEESAYARNESCAALNKLKKKSREDLKKKLEKLTWMEACTKMCKITIFVDPMLPRRLNRRNKN